MKRTSNQVSPTNSDLGRRFKIERNSLVVARSSDEQFQGSNGDKSVKISKIKINEKNRGMKKSLMKSSGSFVIDFNKENSAFKSRRMIKTISGAIKTVDEMKEEYYNVKRFNVELLVDNQELGRLNNELNSEALRQGKELSQLKQDLDEQKTQTRANRDQLSQAQEHNEELLTQNKKLVEDSKAMTDFMLMNFSKVGEDLKDSRDELGFVKRELAIEIQLLRRIVLKKLVPRLEEANNNCTLLCAVNDAYEKEKGEVSLKVNMIQRVCEEGSGKADFQQINELCTQIFEIQDQTKSQDSDSMEEYGEPSRDSLDSQNQAREPRDSKAVKKDLHAMKKPSFSDQIYKSGDQNKMPTFLTVPSKDYNKLIYSELSLETQQKLSHEKNVLGKVSVDRNLKYRGSQALAEKSRETNESAQKYQINYDNSYMGQSSSGESEEFNNGMDVLLKEYMTDKMKKKTSEASSHVPRPPYNTEQHKEVNLDEYILRTGEEELTDSDKDQNKQFNVDLNTKGELKIPEVKDRISQSQSLSRNWPTSKNNEIEDGNLDRESGFEDIVENLIGVMCLEDETLRKHVCRLYNKLFEKNEDQLMGTNEEMLRSLQESLNFKNKMIECLSEDEKQEVAREALRIFKEKLNESAKSGSLKVRQGYNSVKKKSRGNETTDELVTKVDQLEKENKVFVGELERQNKLNKSMNNELEALKNELEEKTRKEEELTEEVAILQQRLELFNQENQTEMSEYNDEYQGNDPMMHRLSNNMLIIQEADEEYEMDSMLSGQDLQDQAQKMILQKFDTKPDNASIDNESHYSFFKDHGKSDDEGDFDSENIRSLPEIRPKLLKRRATESGRRLSKDHLQKYIDDMSGPVKPKKRKTIGNVGMALVRKRLEKSESYNPEPQKSNTFEFEGMDLKMNRTLDEPTSKSQEFKKIKLKRLISDPISKSVANHDKASELVESPRQLNSETKLDLSLGQSGTVTPEPIISFISQDRTTNQRFNFSKNFEDSENRKIRYLVTEVSTTKANDASRKSKCPTGAQPRTSSKTPSKRTSSTFSEIWRSSTRFRSPRRILPWTLN